MPVLAYRACGSNALGELGDGTTVGKTTLIDLQLADYPLDMAAAGGFGYIDNDYRFAGFTLAVLRTGAVMSWGANSTGQLGDGTTQYRVSPVQVLGTGGQGYLSGVVAIAAAPGTGNYVLGGHVLALLDDGRVVAWGVNQTGQLGNGTTTPSSVPVLVTGLTDLVVAVACGGGARHYDSYPLPGSSYALTGKGEVWAWGFNGQGQLGDGTTTNRTAPVKSLISNVKAICAGSSGIPSYTDGSYAGHVLALKEDGTVWAWGLNNVGQLGDGTTTNRATPVQVSGLSNIVAIAAGGYAHSAGVIGGHSLALRADGTVWAWGLNNYGQLGDGTTTNRSTPVQVSGLTDVVAIGAGGYHSVALKKDGTVWAWGYNGYGQLGDGTTTDRTTPVQVSNTGQLARIWKVVSTRGHYTVLMCPESGRIHFGELGDRVIATRWLGAVLAGGQIGPVGLPLYNFCPSAFSGVKVTRMNLPPGDVIEISATREPFVAEDPVYFGGTFNPSEKIGTVWVRVKPPILVDSQPNQGLKQFTLKATNAQ